MVAVGIHAEEHLFLQFQQFPTHPFVAAEDFDCCAKLGKHLAIAFLGQGKGHAHQRALTNLLVGSPTADLEQHFPLRDIGHCHGREHDGADEQRSVAAVDGRREQQFRVERFFARSPLFREQQRVEKQIQMLQMFFVERFQAVGRGFVRFQREHGQILHIALEQPSHGVVVA